MPYMWLLITDEDYLPPVGSFGVEVEITPQDLTLDPGAFTQRLSLPATYRLFDLHKEREDRYALKK